jgi:hypothetical protein
MLMIGVDLSFWKHLSSDVLGQSLGSAAICVSDESFADTSISDGPSREEVYFSACYPQAFIKCHPIQKELIAASTFELRKHMIYLCVWVVGGPFRKAEVHHLFKDLAPLRRTRCSVPRSLPERFAFPRSSFMRLATLRSLCLPQQCVRCSSRAPQLPAAPFRGVHTSCK